MRLGIPDQFEKEELSQQPRRTLSNRLKNNRDLIDLQDMIEDSASKISFIGSFFCQQSPNREPEISCHDAVGLYYILRDIEDDLDMVVDELGKNGGKD